ncbi:C47 family peptidase [Staphylococcus warneri]|uniref:C47 family peptidase n=1 Tax=Staphylococcus warneri TaxID=1292 RepID=UPI000736FCFD|nr:C47 family peptidase [Staphylococcus warneri]MBJ7887504.1 cysteine protease [Bacillaceae bacterium HSR45]MCC8989817.1 cysteine protease staphopain [Staphylococcus sp.]SKR78753.1 Staphopain B precursor [Mycobacteroides abscessus subsp. abscessus]KTW24550.1 cysteine protease [Staphylococcus warneri]MBP3032819.1 cysteine protease [Staphylococcus warneri]
MHHSYKHISFKLISILLFAILLLSTIAFTDLNKSYAAQKSNQLEINVKNDKVPQKVQNLAQQQYKGYAQALDKQKNSQTGDYQLGEAFKIYKFNGEEDNSYYYPVLKDGKIIYTLTISPKNEADLKQSKENANYSVKISNFIAKDLEEIKDKHTNITILTDEKGFYFEENGQVRLVKATPLPTNIKNKENSQHMSSHLKQQLKATSEPTKINENQAAEANQDNQVQYENTLKNFKIREQQFDNSWCAGFSMAALLNATKNTDKYNAHDIMRTLYPNVSEEELPQFSTNPHQMIKYGNSQGRDIQHQSGMPSYNQIDQLTKDNKGAMILAHSVENNPNDPHLGHAMAVVGNAKINNEDKLIFWNPWDTDLSIQDADSNLLHLSFNRDYTWDDTMIGY